VEEEENSEEDKNVNTIEEDKTSIPLRRINVNTIERILRRIMIRRYIPTPLSTINTSTN
jgi:hypothetical protein